MSTVSTARHVPGSEPYAWPWDGRLDGATIALVLAGWDAGWRARALDVGETARARTRLAAAVVAAGGQVITVSHSQGRPLPPPGATTATEVSATGTDGFWGGPLEPVLRREGLTHLFVAGHGLEGPVHSFLRGANDRGFECLLVTDACSALTPDCRDASASMVCMSGGIFGAVGTTDAVVATLTPSPQPIPEEVP